MDMEYALAIHSIIIGLLAVNFFYIVIAMHLCLDIVASENKDKK